MVERAQIVLAAEGLKGVEIAERVGLPHPLRVCGWRSRAAAGCAGCRA